MSDCFYCEKFSSCDQSHKTSIDPNLHQIMMSNYYILKQETQIAYCHDLTPTSN